MISFPRCFVDLDCRLRRKVDLTTPQGAVADRELVSVGNVTATVQGVGKTLGGVMRLIRTLLLLGVLVGACSGQDVMSLQVGDCFDETTSTLGGGEVERVPDVNCDGPHDLEVFHIVDYPGSTFNEAMIDDFAVEQCYSAFSRYVGRDYESSILDFSYLRPTRDGWGSGGRNVVCVVGRMDYQKLRGSVRDSGL